MVKKRYRCATFLPGLIKAACAFFITASYILGLLLIPLHVRHLLESGVGRTAIAWFIAGSFVCLTLPISLYHIYQHLTHFVQPKQQNQIVRIIWMVPIYAVESFLSLRFYNYAVYIQTVREAYEAYVIYCFFGFILSYLADSNAELSLSGRLALKPPHIGRHKCPFCCLKPWGMGEEFLRNCKIGILQYVVVRNITTAATLVLEPLQLYNEGAWDPYRGYMWITLINCISQTWALYVLVLFYHGCHKDLHAINPFGKFFAVKSVVFFSWWQALGIELLVHRGMLQGSEDHTVQATAKGLQDLLICMEMFFAALAFLVVFPAKEFVKWKVEVLEGEGGVIAGGGEEDRQSFMAAFWNSSLPIELHSDVSEAAAAARTAARSNARAVGARIAHKMPKLNKLPNLNSLPKLTPVQKLACIGAGPKGGGGGGARKNGAGLVGGWGLMMGGGAAAVKKQDPKMSPSSSRGGSGYVEVDTVEQ